ncbi:hypothetical protein QTP88_000518 [Uroleucon formosanum]
MEDPASQNVKNSNVHEAFGDIFETPEEFHLVHCVSGDLKLSRGIALEFRRRYGHIEKLKQQHPKKTEVAYFKLGSRYILNLVTKEKCWQKPTLQDIYESLLNLRRFCQEVEIKKLAMLRIGSGLDQLDESAVLQMIKYIFRNSGILIQVISQQNAFELDKHAIIHEHHATVLGGHRGIQQTIKRIQCQYDWEGLKQDVTEFINKCTSCQVNTISNRNTKQPMIISTTASEPFEKVFIDVVGPLTRTLDGNAYILTMQCDLTKFSIATPMAKKESNTVAYHFVTSFVCIHGMPQSLVSDQVPNSLTKAPDARYNYDDYQTELKQKLRESHQIARERLIQKKQKTKFDYDQTAHSVDIHVGDRILLQDKARKGKLSAKWLGPYEVLELNCNDNVTILRGKKKAKTNIVFGRTGYTINSVPESGILYQPIGTVHPVVNEFKLVNFLNISALDTNHNDIVAFHKQLEIFCKQYIWEHQSTAVLSSCEWMKSSTTSIFHQIEQVKGEILGSLDSNYQSTRVRRGLFNAVGRVSKVLFGVCSDEDAEFLNSKISELSSARTDTLNILEAQTRIVRATNDLVTHLSEKLGKSLSALSELDAREMLSEQVIGISLLLTQQAFGIQKLLHIVNSAIHGQAHPSLMTHQQYVEHLREIQLTLPIGSNLPFPLEKFSITKFIQVTQVAILLANNTLIFIQKIPLISSNSYKGYRLIPFPVRQQGQTYSIFTSVPSVLALSSNREYFIPLTESHRLESTNTWLYVSVSENVAIKCDNEDPHNIILNGTGQLTFNPQCVLYAKQTILFPSQTIFRNSSQNLYNPIQSEGLGSLSVTNISQDLFESLNFSESHYSIGLEDLSRHSKSLKEIEELIKVEKNTNYVPKENLRNTINILAAFVGLLDKCSIPDMSTAFDTKTII